MAGALRQPPRPLEQRPSDIRKAGARRAVDYWTRPFRKLRVVHRCGCEPLYTLSEGPDGCEQVERLRRLACVLHRE